MRFLAKKKLDQPTGIWSYIYPEFSWDSTEENSGIEGPDIVIKFASGALDTSLYDDMGPKFGEIVAARIRNHDRFGIWFDEEAVVVRDDAKRNFASEGVQLLLQEYANQVGNGVPVEEVIRRIKGGIPQLEIDEGPALVLPDGSELPEPSRKPVGRK